MTSAITTVKSQQQFVNPLDTHMQSERKMVVSLTSSSGFATSASAASSSSHKRELEKEKSSVSTDSSSNSASTGGTTGGSGGSGGGGGASSSASSKLSKIGRRLRDSCRNLRVKSNNGSGSTRCNPEEFVSARAAEDSNRSKHYVSMDFSGKVGKICAEKDIKAFTSKDGYAYFRRKVLPKEVINLLTESQTQIHLTQPWFHRGMGRDVAQKVLAAHNVDGAFLVRDSSVVGGFVVSYVASGRTYHAQVLPDSFTSPTTGAATAFYSLDEGKTRFYDLMQLVEFYQLNQGTLNTRLSHYIIKRPATPQQQSNNTAAATAGKVTAAKATKDAARSESPGSRRSYASSGCEVSMDSQNGASTSSADEMSSQPPPSSNGDITIKKDFEKSKPPAARTAAPFIAHLAKDSNHNTEAEDCSGKGAAASAAAAASTEVVEDSAMASEGDSDSMREFQQG